MEAKVVQRPQISSAWIDKIPRKPNGSLRLPMREKQRLQLLNPRHQQALSCRQKPTPLEVSCSYRNFPATMLETGSNINNSLEEWSALQTKAQEVQTYLNGRCIYLVGMMGCGKTSVGEVLSQVLGYTFRDSDKLIEEDVNGTPISDIFKLYGEGFFRDKETEALKKLSIMHRIVVSTGGGAVIRPVNWKYMQKGISVWIDVPVEALAQRISAVGTHSRPLLHDNSGDVYTSTYRRLSSLLEERSEAYANANARVSLENIAAKLGYRDVCALSKTAIAIEVLDQIENHLQDEEGMAFGTF